MQLFLGRGWRRWDMRVWENEADTGGLLLVTCYWLLVPCSEFRVTGSVFECQVAVRCPIIRYSYFNCSSFVIQEAWSVEQV
jgi:hypothetical protein